MNPVIKYAGSQLYAFMSDMNRLCFFMCISALINQ